MRFKSIEIVGTITIRQPDLLFSWENRCILYTSCSELSSILVRLGIKNLKNEIDRIVRMLRKLDYVGERQATRARRRGSDKRRGKLRSTV